MDTRLPKKVGNVVIDVVTDTPETTYTDDAEDTLLNLFKLFNPDRKRQQILANSPSWPLYYHLSPRRSNLLRWYEFKPGSTILEVGAGCGAITEELVRNDVKVTALELTKKRSLINAYRNKKASNLHIVIGDLADYETSKRFDYIVCVGVLEWTGTFFHSSNPYLDFLKALKGVLKPGGKMLLAIENRFGLKYWAGAGDDHIKAYFEGVNGYKSGTVQTFGRKELTDLLKTAGYSIDQFFYPYPDYKVPDLVFSDKYYPGHRTSFPIGKLPTPALNRERQYLFSEQNAMRFIEKNGLFRDFSNSFLVEVAV